MPRPEAEDNRVVEPALEELCRAARQVGLYTPHHPVAAGAVENAAAALGSLLARGRPLMVSVSQDGLEADGQALDLGRPGLRQLQQQLRSHSIQTLSLHPGLQAYELEALLAVLNTEPEQLDERGGATREFATMQAPHIGLEQYDYRRLVRQSEAQWLATFSGAAEARSSAVEQLVNACFEAVGDDDALLETSGDGSQGRPVPQWVAAAEQMASLGEEEPSEGAHEAGEEPLSPQDYLARSLAILVQRAWERLASRDYSERVRWRDHMSQLIELLAPEMRARLFRAELMVGAGREPG